MSLREIACGFCQGSGEAEVLEVWVDSCHSWFRTPRMTDQERMAYCNEHQVRWVDAKCPRCHGMGSHMVEYFTCKIF